MATKPVNGGISSPAANVFAPPAAPQGKVQDTGEATRAKPVVGPANTGAGAADAKPREASNVQISPGAKDRAEAFQKAFDIAKKTPDVREDKVQDLKARIANGTYQIDSGKIADGMAREAIMEHLAEGEER